MESLHFKRGSQRFWSLEGWHPLSGNLFLLRPDGSMQLSILWIFSKCFHVRCLLILTKISSRNLTSRPLEQ